MNRLIFESAFIKISAISVPLRFPPLNVNIRTLYFFTISNSARRYFIFLSFVSTIHPLLPTALSHSTSSASAAKMSSCNFTSIPLFRRASATTYFPMDRSRKNIRGSGGLPIPKFASDRFLDFFFSEFIVCHQVVHRFPGL